ncbi:RNA polymerase sigma factor [Cryptosporangium phraense]|uniref:Sigma-70 family RNA polymerase sigma factor n=1 Tax=Cryptosporangium phraense TaxID=2593070 RepID=A0A545AHC4_9ACTN|nr:sigma-70 family RNA polymerase sigma factor [Cryptosporangium phraense]TQS40085.1 sigma-70 family RNA polymerase sigma factor [Cryptosporangium phraense]
MSSDPERSVDLLALYDRALPDVYGYLRARCGSTALAEDLTGETFLAAVAAVRQGRDPTVAWLITVARNKLVDHWRREAREQRSLQVVEPAEDPWDVQLDVVRARDVLQRLGPQHRLALTLRYVDDLPVPEVARLLGRTRHATEALIVRARAAFRAAYEEGSSDD